MNMLYNKLKYHTSEINFRNNNQTKKVLEWVPSYSTILELGCHTGLLSKVLHLEKNAKITGIEINKEALQIAKEWQEQSYIADIEKIDEWGSFISNKKFDVILLLHVLEHLRNPEEVLSKLKDFLNPDGLIIIGLPNISNIHERIGMLLGRFEYTETGVMDNTHYKMFNYHSALKLIKESNLKLNHYFPTRQLSPIKELFDYLPFFWKIGLKFKSKPSFLFRNWHNMIDETMLFKCSI
jgi:2-polyprenyl-3-methyl-5-hydroxy-6-metoxy-1,4-benzoquinol methylase